MAGPSLEQLAALAAALGLGGAATKALELLAKRNSQARKEPADLTRAAAEFQNALTGGAKDLIDHLVSETGSLRLRTDQLQAKADAAAFAAEEAKGLARSLEQAHARCEAELEQQRRLTTEQQRQIDLLMAGRVAATGEAAP